MAKRWLAGGIALLAMLAGTGTASAGTYEVVSCGAPGANGVNGAWQVLPSSDDSYYDVAASCPELSAWSERRPGVTAPYFSGAGFRVTAPAGATLDRMVIWRTGYRFNSTGSAHEQWVVAGYRGDGSVIGGPLAGETCHLGSSVFVCRFGEEGAMAPGARAERDLETDEIVYSVACGHPSGCGTANSESFPFAAVSISGSVITVRDEAPPAAIAGGPLTAPGWRVDNPPLNFGATDPVGVRRVRVLVDGAQVHRVAPACDFRRVVPCGQVSERRLRLGAAIPDGTRVVSVEATDTAGNVARVDRHGRRRPQPAGARVPAGEGAAPDRRGGPRCRRRHDRGDDRRTPPLGGVPGAADAAARRAARRAAAARVAARADLPGERRRRGRPPRGGDRCAGPAARRLRRAYAALGAHRV